MALGRRLEVATRGKDERDAAILKRVGDRPGGFLAQVEVEDGEVKALRLNLWSMSEKPVVGLPVS